MRDHALELVAAGVTSIEEVNRVLTDDAESVHAAARERKRVLVTDDEPITRMLVKLLLEREHFEVLEATNGRDAVAIATRERPDLLLIDLNMPEMDGYEAIARLQEGSRPGHAADHRPDGGGWPWRRAARARARRRRLHPQALRPGHPAFACQRRLPPPQGHGSVSGMRSTFSALIAALLVTGSTVYVRAQATSTPRDLTRVSIEDLMEIEITSAAKKEQRAEDVPAAVFVITQDDIRRSGMRSLPELFRLVPGMQVAQVNSNKWAVSIRGFNGLFSNKLLVLVDGRSIYTAFNFGVFWDE